MNVEQNEFEPHEGWNGDPISFRIREAKLFLSEYRSACENIDGFRAAAMADAALLVIASIKELTCEEGKSALLLDPAFSLALCLRNLTAHEDVVPNRTVLAHIAIQRAEQESRRLIFILIPSDLDQELSERGGSGRLSRKSSELAREYLKPYIADGKPLGFGNIIQNAIECVERIIVKDCPQCS